MYLFQLSKGCADPNPFPSEQRRLDQERPRKLLHQRRVGGQQGKLIKMEWWQWRFSLLSGLRLCGWYFKLKGPSCWIVLWICALCCENRARRGGLSTPRLVWQDTMRSSTKLLKWTRQQIARLSALKVIPIKIWTTVIQSRFVSSTSWEILGSHPA